MVVWLVGFLEGGRLVGSVGWVVVMLVIAWQVGVWVGRLVGWLMGLSDGWYIQ